MTRNSAPISFIETQFPIARLSAESYKERRSNTSQTLTGLGKWWGRKPLILVRASIVGMLLPASSDPKKDREIFLKILTMDDEGTWERSKLTAQRKTSKTEFDRLPYAERIVNCERPENVKGPSETTWKEINKHLGTNASSLAELVEELGHQTFGHTPRVGDSFCGGGSIPFEAARIGCTAFGSDLNPVACLLTWASLNLLGGAANVQEELMRIQASALAEADRQVTDWGIEHNERGERIDALLYCVEVRPEGCAYYIPLAPSWLIGEKSKVIARWHSVKGTDRLKPEILIVSDDELQLYKDKKGATVIDSRAVDPFDNSRSWSIESLRGPEGLRLWTNDDVVPRPGDVFQERLYCIRWIDKKGNRRYAAPDAADIARETKVLKLLRERFSEWQREGFIPSKTIVSGYNTDQPIRERGWTHWHHLFNPRQLLTHGLLAEICFKMATHKESQAGCLLGIGRMANWNSRLSSWVADASKEGGSHTFANQALNTLFTYSVRPIPKFDTAWPVISKASHSALPHPSLVASIDARDIQEECDFWITDPPYADAVNYHELGDYFLAWYEKGLSRAFPDWITDARTELAVRGDGDEFRRSMVDIYKNLAVNMPSNGLQLVMFTHKDPSVWAGLGMILWAAGLKATAAWTISTETKAVGIKKGNYVQGTVCLVLRKRISSEPGFLDEIFPLVEDEVRNQIDSMKALDEEGEPNFNDADYQLASYAAALKVLTQYSNIDGKDVENEVFAVRDKNQKSDFQAVIERAIGIACDHLIPKGLEIVWRDLNLAERYYLRALDIESRGERRMGMYEELARGFGTMDIKPLLKSDKANGARMFTASGLGKSILAGAEGQAADTPRKGRANTASPHPFASSPLRHLMFAIKETTDADNNPEQARQYLRDTYGQAYWTKRELFIGLLDWMSALSNAEGMNEWNNDSEACRILAGRLRNDHT